MLYRELGSTGEKITVLGLGCMRLPVLNGKYDKVDIDNAIPLIRKAIDSGINYLDTAYPYHNGQSETVIAEALKAVSYTHLRAHETVLDLVCRLLLEKKKKKKNKKQNSS